MNDNHPTARVVVLGATGGLGGATARRFARSGARLLLAGRDPDRLGALADTLPGRPATAVADLTRPATLADLHDAAIRHLGAVDVVVNATGVDVRAPLAAHSDVDITRTVEVNLVGAIRLTTTFLPTLVARGRGTIVHIGGFADGRLALPYHSVDVASRAGLAAFVESVNRELDTDRVRVCFFSPSAADTAAERPYHALWRALGVPVVSAEEVADAVWDAVGRGSRRAIMGGRSTRWFAALNAVAPRLADRIALNRYRAVLRHHLGSPA